MNKIKKEEKVKNIIAKDLVVLIRDQGHKEKGIQKYLSNLIPDLPKVTKNLEQVLGAGYGMLRIFFNIDESEEIENSLKEIHKHLCDLTN